MTRRIIMCVSLYAHGPTRLEIGKYGKDLYNAKRDFYDKCVRLGLEVEEKPAYRGYELRIVKGVNEEKTYDDKLQSLLYELAYVDDWKTSPPTIYMMHEEHVPEDGYIKTNVVDRRSLQQLA